ALERRTVEREDREELPSREPRIEALLHRRGRLPPDGGMPQPHRRVRPTVARPLDVAPRVRPAHLELVAVDEQCQWLTRRAAGHDLVDTALVVVVGEEIEVEVFAQERLGRHREALEIRQRADVVWPYARFPERLAPIRDVLVGVTKEPLEAAQLERLELRGCQPLRLAQFVQVARRIA